ncbi:hypothetical protein BJ508DRAFT_376892 [Ascobolus immersus RN42]|uniref:Uncharacterized protein n=1 Tax=Ascobolus immersus RN42 TaxID=1160509 RepID=A0A3N4I951_ASCIM|nr:hypothetical protein BJ508DRAFT_376892 [Ascobolus immersus RN42]
MDVLVQGPYDKVASSRRPLAPDPDRPSLPPLESTIRKPLQNDEEPYSIAKLHQTSHTRLDSELLCLWKRQLRPESSVEEVTSQQSGVDLALYFMYGPAFDEFPVPDALLHLDEELFKLFHHHDVHAIAHGQPTTKSLGFESLQYDLMDIHQILSRRHQAHLIRPEQIDLIRAVYRSTMRFFRNCLRESLNHNKGPDICTPPRYRKYLGHLYDNTELELSFHRNTLLFIASLRSDRIESLLLRYSDEEGVNMEVVEGIKEATIACERYVRGLPVGPRREEKSEYHFGKRKWVAVKSTRRQQAWMALYFGEDDGQADSETKVMRVG